MCQSIFSEFLDNPEQLTTYSWRRMLPTVGHMLQMQSSDLCSLGDWQDRSKEPADAGMALHYSSADMRNPFATRSWLLQWPTGHSFWEGVQPSDLDGFRETAKEKLALSIARDKETLYAAQPTRESLKTHLQFSRARVAAVSATKIRDSAQRSAVSMPDAAFAALVNSPRGVTRGKSKAFLWCGRRTLSVIGCWMSPMTSPIRFDSNRCTISWQMWTSSVRPSIVPRKFGRVKFPGLFHYGRNNSLMAYLHFKGGISNASPLTTRHVNSSWRRSGCCTIGAEGPSGRTHGAAFIGGPPRHL